MADATNKYLDEGESKSPTANMLAERRPLGTIDFTSPTIANDGSPPVFLPLPDPSESIVTFSQKTAALTELVMQGKSVAVHTDFQATTYQSRDPEKIAMASMRPPQLRTYMAWKECKRVGGEMPVFDWTANVAPVPNGEYSAKHFAERAEAMDIMWDHQGATAENAAWLTENRQETLSLVTAITKVMRTEKVLNGGSSGGGGDDDDDVDEGGMSALELAECQTVHKIWSLAQTSLDQAHLEVERIYATAAARQAAAKKKEEEQEEEEEQQQQQQQLVDAIRNQEY